MVIDEFWVVSKCAYAFEHDWALVLNVVECGVEGVPGDLAVSGREVEVLVAVVVVDVGGGEESACGEGLGVEVSDEVCVA